MGTCASCWLTVLGFVRELSPGRDGWSPEPSSPQVSLPLFSLPLASMMVTQGSLLRLISETFLHSRSFRKSNEVLGGGVQMTPNTQQIFHTIG